MKICAVIWVVLGCITIEFNIETGVKLWPMCTTVLKISLHIILVKEVLILNTGYQLAWKWKYRQEACQGNGTKENLLHCELLIIISFVPVACKK